MMKLLNILHSGMGLNNYVGVKVTTTGHEIAIELYIQGSIEQHTSMIISISEDDIQKLYMMMLDDVSSTTMIETFMMLL